MDAAAEDGVAVTTRQELKPRLGKPGAEAPVIIGRFSAFAAEPRL
jgi:hypothetical protein